MWKKNLFLNEILYWNMCKTQYKIWPVRRPRSKRSPDMESFSKNPPPDARTVGPEDRQLFSFRSNLPIVRTPAPVGGNYD